MQKQVLLSFFKARGNICSVRDLKRIHATLVKTELHQSNFAVGNFISYCAVLNLMNYAIRVFEQMLEPNSFVWNTMIRGFQQNQEPNNSLIFFSRMPRHNVKHDEFTFPFIVKACADLKDFNFGQSLHGRVLKLCFISDIFVATSLIEFYVVYGIKIAHQLFDEISVRDSVMWTVLVSGYVNQCDDLNIAHKLFDEMPVKDLVTWNTMIDGYVKIGDIGSAKKLFNVAPVKDTLMCNTILGGYAKCGEVDDMLQLFYKMRVRDVISWNTAINGLVQSNKIKEAMTLFHQMQHGSIQPNKVTVITILSACARMGALDIGRWIHSYIDNNKISLDILVGTTLVDMYTKCGDLENALHVFEQIPFRDSAAWNAMIMGFSMNGESHNALDFFHRMQNEGIKPNEVTMIGVLCACTHAGLVSEGKKWFDAMNQSLGITPKIEHYGCMVDLLGRAGLLNEAYEFIRTMPLVPHAGVWGALLGACKIHGNIDLAEICIKHLMELDVKDGGYLAIMSNLYANAGRWSDFSKIRQIMKVEFIDKKLGISSIQVNGEISSTI